MAAQTKQKVLQVRRKEKKTKIVNIYLCIAIMSEMFLCEQGKQFGGEV